MWNDWGTYSELPHSVHPWTLDCSWSRAKVSEVHHRYFSKQLVDFKILFGQENQFLKMAFASPDYQVIRDCNQSDKKSFWLGRESFWKIKFQVMNKVSKRFFGLIAIFMAQKLTRDSSSMWLWNMFEFILFLFINKKNFKTKYYEWPFSPETFKLDFLDGQI